MPNENHEPKLKIMSAEDIMEMDAEVGISPIVRKGSARELFPGISRSEEQAAACVHLYIKSELTPLLPPPDPQNPNIPMIGAKVRYRVGQFHFFCHNRKLILKVLAGIDEENRNSCHSIPTQIPVCRMCALYEGPEATQ
jgi:hypothetical protein